MSALTKLARGATLEADELREAFDTIMDGAASADETKAFLTGTIPLMADPAALAAGANALRARMVRVTAPAGAIDVCGTGGDGGHTLNISTAVAFVVAGCGVAVAKHGNRAMSSKSGAADVLEALGVKLTGDVATLERCLREAHIAFLFAQNHHPAMRHVAAARRELGVRTIFNLLGPLSNPAGVKRQLVGVFARDWMVPMAEALNLLGAEAAWVVHGHGGLDELSLESDRDNDVAALEDGMVRTFRVCGSHAGAMTFPNAALAGGAPAENAAAIRRLLEGETPNAAYLESVLFNAAAALIVAGRAKDLEDGYETAARALVSGDALTALNRLIAITSAAP